MLIIVYIINNIINNVYTYNNIAIYTLIMLIILIPNGEIVTLILL